MANDQKKPLTEEEKKKHIKKTLDEIEEEKKKVKKGDNFTAPTEEQLRKKLERTDSPFNTSRVGDLLLPVEQSTITLALQIPIPCRQSGYLRTCSSVLATS